MRKMMLAAVAATAIVATPAVAQQNGLVNVDVKNVLNNLELDLLNNSLNNNTVQVPIGVAANVCGISVLAIREGGNKCEAKNASTALGQALSKQGIANRK